MTLVSAWDLVKLVAASAIFGWRSERAAGGDWASAVVALFFGVWALAIAYRLWVTGRVQP